MPPPLFPKRKHDRRRERCCGIALPATSVTLRAKSSGSGGKTTQRGKRVEKIDGDGCDGMPISIPRMKFSFCSSSLITSMHAYLPPSDKGIHLHTGSFGQVDYVGQSHSPFHRCFVFLHNRSYMSTVGVGKAIAASCYCAGAEG